MDSINISTDLLSRITGLEKDELLGQIQTDDGNLKDNYEESLKTVYGTRLSSIKEEQRNRGIREKGESIERYLKDLFSANQIEATRAEDGIKELTEKLKNQGGNGSTEPDELTIDKIKSLPIAQQWLNSEVQALKDAKAEKEAALQELQNQFHTYKIGGTAKSKALEVLTNANAVGANPESVGLFLKALGTSNIKVAEDGAIKVLDSNGDPLKDKFHSDVTFDKYIKENWKFGFSEAPTGSGSPNYKPNNQGQGGTKIRFKDPQHYEESIKNAGSDLRKKSELRRAWAEQLKEQEK